MKTKVLSLTGIVLIILGLTSCSSKPEESLLKKYFNAISLKDTQTMNTMAFKPLNLEVKDWEIVNIGEERGSGLLLGELDKKEQEVKKQREDAHTKTLDALIELDNAKFELENAYTRNAKRAAQKKIDEKQAIHDEFKVTYLELQKEYNTAKTESSTEEKITKLSISTKDVPNIRQHTGELKSKEVDIKCTSTDDKEKNYRVYMRKYTITDEVTKFTRRGRWIITKFELI